MSANHTFMRMLIEREPFMLAKAEEAKEAGKTASEVMYRSLAADAAMLYAAFVGDNPRAALAEHHRHLLENAVRKMDEELLDYRVLMAQAELEKDRVSA